jgi:hypothetical protein
VLPFSMLHDAFSQVLLKIFLYHPLDLIPLDFLQKGIIKEQGLQAGDSEEKIGRTSQAGGGTVDFRLKIM